MFIYREFVSTETYIVIFDLFNSMHHYRADASRRIQEIVCILI